MDWGQILTTLFNASPMWAPFLAALFGILFFVVKPLLNGVRESQVQQTAAITAMNASVTTAITNLALNVQKAVDGQNTLLGYLAPHSIQITTRVPVDLPVAPPAQ